MNRQDELRFQTVVPASTRMRRWAAVPGVVLVLAMSLAGCGSGASSEQETTAEAWVDDVCTSISTWDDTVSTAEATLRDRANLSVDDFKNAVQSVVDATGTLVDEAVKLGPPDTEASKEAEKQLSSLSAKLRAESEALGNAINSEAATITEVLANLSTIMGSLSSMIADVKTTVDRIGSLDGGAELQQAFEGSENCQQLSSGG